MSYILDAMLQAERERQFPCTPGLSTVQALPRLPCPPRRRGRLVAAAGVAGLAALALASAWLLPRPDDTPAARPVAIVGPEAVAPTSAALVKLAEPPAIAPAPMPALPPAVPVDIPAAAPETAREAPAAEATGGPAADAPPRPRRPAPRAQPRAKARAVAAVPGKRIYRPAELPAELRRAADGIKVAGFAWSDDPKERLAIINNRALREGEEVARGLRVERIVGDGVVFSFKGYRFRKGPT